MEDLLTKLTAAIAAARRANARNDVEDMARFLIAFDDAFPVLPEGFDQFAHEVTLGQPRSARETQISQLEAAATALGMVIRRPPDDAWVVCAQCGGRRSDAEGACQSCDAEVTECESWGPKLPAPRGPAPTVPLATAEATVVLGHVVRSGVAGFIDAIRRPIERTGPSAVDRAAYETAKRVEALLDKLDDVVEREFTGVVEEMRAGAAELVQYVTGYVDTRLPASVADPFWYCASCGDIERARVDTALGATSACKCNAQRTAVKRAEATITAAAAIRAAGGIEIERFGASDRAAGIADYIRDRTEAIVGGIGWDAMDEARRATRIALVTKFLDQLGAPSPAWLNVTLHYEGSTCTAIAGGLHGLFDGDRLEVLVRPERVFDVAAALFGAGVAALARASAQGPRP